jgi:hypothetical protein
VEGESFYRWVDGVRSTYFDPLLRCGFGLDPMPEDWAPRLRQVGVDPFAEGPLDDGKFHVLESSIAMAVNHTGINLTPNFLASAQFVVGEADDA